MIGKFCPCGLVIRAAGTLFVVGLGIPARAENPYLTKGIQAYENFEYQLYGTGAAALVAAVILFFAEPGGAPPGEPPGTLGIRLAPFGVQGTFRF